MKNKINCFLIGAQKAGTTSLYDWLGQHPNIKAPREAKDYHFFSNPDLFQKGIESLEKFYEPFNKKVIIHAGVNYLYNAKIVAERIYNYNSDSKIIVCLRDPVDRAISAYKYFVRIGIEKNSFEEAIQREKEQRISGLDKNHFTYIEHGKYFEQLLEFNIKFKGNIKVIFFEELLNESFTQSVMDDLNSFMGVEKFNYDFTHLNRSNTPKFKSLNRLIRGNSKLKLLKKYLPQKLLRNVSRQIEEFNLSSKKIEIKISKESIDLLKSDFKEDIIRLSNFLDKDLTKLWKSAAN